MRSAGVRLTRVRVRQAGEDPELFCRRDVGFTAQRRRKLLVSFACAAGRREHVPAGIPATLAALRARFRLGVVSNANGTVRATFARLGLATHFEVTGSQGRHLDAAFDEGRPFRALEKNEVGQFFDHAELRELVRRLERAGPEKALFKLCHQMVKEWYAANDPGNVRHADLTVWMDQRLTLRDKVTLHLDRDVNEQLDLAARVEGKERSEVTSEILRKHLPRYRIERG